MEMNRSAQYPGIRWLVLCAAVLATATHQIYNVSISPLLPQIAKGLNIGLGDATNFMAVFILSAAIVLLFGGVVCDRFGALTAMIVGVACATIPATLMPWIGTSYHAVLWVRMAQGVGCGFIVSTTAAVVAVWFPEKQRGLAGGILTASMAVGAALGFVSGPAIFSVTKDWKTMVALLSIVGWVALILLALSIALLRKFQPPAEAQPRPGASNAAVFRSALVVPLTWIGVLVVCVANWPTHCLQSLIPGYLSADKLIGGAGYGPMTAGQLMLGVTVAGMIAPLIAGFLLDKVLRGNTALTMVLGFALAAAGSYAMIVHWVIGSIALTETALVLLIMGVQFVFTMLVVFVANSYPAHVTGKIYGLWNGIGLFGGVIGIYGGVQLGIRRRFGGAARAL